MLTIGAYTISVLQILTTAVCALALLTLHLFLRRTNQGLGMLAASQDFQATRLMGISADRVIAGAFVVSGVLAAIAAIFITARRGTVDPFMGFNPVLKAFIATVIGGLGSLGGAVAAASFWRVSKWTRRYVAAKWAAVPRCLRPLDRRWDPLCQT